MKKYKYKDVTITIKYSEYESDDFQIGEEQYMVKRFMEAINELGREGWNLTAIISQKFGFTAIFKYEWEVTPNTGPK